MNLFNAELFRFDKLALFVGGFIGFFSLLIVVYSISFMRERKDKIGYYLCIILTMLASLGVVFSNNLVLLMGFWGFLGILLYLLISYGKAERTAATAKKAFIIIGGTDAFMLLGLAFVWQLAGTLQMDKISIALTSKEAVYAYLCLAAGAFAKAGSMPFHTWVPDTAEDAPVPVTAFLPASLDKLLGIYFLARISMSIFQMNSAMNTFLMALGSFTIIAAVMMALVQHDLKRLLGYHAVSQVGYMVLGIGTGTPIGMAGGLFHMLNNAIYKSCLFLSGGAVEKKAGTSDLEKLGGFAKSMPVTFLAFLIASFAISGVPPFNGFVSKWMVYQGVIKAGQMGSRLWVIWLVAAMFGSALTLASFMKLIHAVFLGQPSKESMKISQGKQEVGLLMWGPSIALALLCVVFGVFAYNVPLKMFILPSITSKIVFYGVWSSDLATALILIGIIIGVIIYLIGTVKNARESEVFVGGEIVAEHPDMRISGTRFYDSIENIGFLKFFYNAAAKKLFDIYDIGTNFTLGVNKVLRNIHNGVLSSYLAWCLLGMIILFYFLLR